MNDIQDALACIPAFDRDLWVRIAMAIKSEMGDSGFSLWDSWSQTADSYNPRDAADVWRSITPGPVKIGTLFHIAREHGYRAGSKLSERIVPQRKAPPPPKRDTGVYAAEIWLRADCSDDAVTSHPYAIAKGVESAGGAGRATVTGRVVGKDADCIVVPIRNLTGNKVVAVQCINASGSKQTFGPVSGNALLLGNTLDSSLDWFVAEGWASAYSLVFHHCAGNACCAAAFGKGNLDNVAHAIAKVYGPDRLVIVRERDAA
jgi:putative DNA primase/helicase